MIELNVLYTETTMNPEYKEVGDLYKGMDLENLGIEKPDDDNNKWVVNKVWHKISIEPGAIIYIEHYIGDDTIADTEGGGSRVGLLDGTCFTVKEPAEVIRAKINNKWD